MLGPVDVIWMENPLSDDNRAHYATNSLLNLALDHAEVGFIHRNGWKEKPKDCAGAVIVVHGEHQAGIADELLSQVMSLSWSLVINTGDEPGIFPLQRFTGERRKVWMQFPIPGVHDYADRRLVAGYPHDCPRLLYTKDTSRKPLNWSYAGQVNHAHRRECVLQLQMMNHGTQQPQQTEYGLAQLRVTDKEFLYESPGFWRGLPREEYYKWMAESKVIPCPGGGATPDSLRLFEALEAGCVPVTDDRWPPGFPRNVRPGLTGYWRYVLGEEPPFPVLTHWSDFPRLLDQALQEWPGNRDRLQVWWVAYKARMARWFEEDIAALR